MDTASGFLERTIPNFNLPYDILAPDGAFPVPVRTDSGFKESYSWYFEDHSLGQIIIPKTIAVQILVNLLKELGLENHHKTIIGFSQGGFLAPFLAKQSLHIDKIIGIGCAYRAEAYENLKNLKVFGIHGEDDIIVDFDKAHEGHRNLIQNGFDGEFAAIKELGHKMNDAARAKLIHFITA